MKRIVILLALLIAPSVLAAPIAWVAGTTSRTIDLKILDSSSTTGAGLSGLVYNSSGLVCSYTREKAARVAITLATQTVTGAYSSGGFVEIDATNFKGLYRLDIPDAALAAGVNFVVLECYGATNMLPVDREIQLIGMNFEDAVAGGMSMVPTDVKKWNGTTVATPATAGVPDVNVKNVNNVAAATPGASGGMLISGSNAGTTTLGALTVTGTTTMSDGLVVNRSTSNSDAVSLTASGSGVGLKATGGAASGATAGGDGIKAIGGAASTTGGGVAGRGVYALGGAGAATTNTARGGFRVESGADNGAGGDVGMRMVGVGAFPGFEADGGATGAGAKFVGGATSGDAIDLTTTSGDGFNSSPTAGNAMVLAANGTSKHGLVATGGTAGTSDGIKGVAGTGGVPIRGNITGNITGTIDTVTTLTNLPAITTNWLTASGIAAGALNGKGDWSTYAGGDTSGTTTLLSRLTSTRAGYLDNLSGGAVALASTALSTAQWTNGRAANLDNLDATVSSRLASSGYTVPPTALANATAVWTDLLASSDFSTVSSVGKLLKDDIDAAVSSRMATYTQPTGFLAATFPGTVASTTNITAATGITVATNSDKTGYTLTVTPPTAATIATTVWQDSTAGDFTTASSIGKSLYNAFTPNTSVYTTASLANAPTGGSSGPTLTQIVNGVWDEPNASHVITGSTGKSLSNSGAASNPWDIDISTYASPTAGHTVQSIRNELSAAALTLSSAVSTNGTSIKFVQGDDRLHADSKEFAFTCSASICPTLSSATMTITQNSTVIYTLTGVVTDVTSDPRTFYFELTSTQTAAMTVASDYKYAIAVQFTTGHKFTPIINGVMQVLGN